MTTINTTSSSTPSFQSRTAATEVLFALLPGNEERTTAAPANNIVPFRVKPVPRSTVAAPPPGTPENHRPYLPYSPTGQRLTNDPVWAAPGTTPSLAQCGDTVDGHILQALRIAFREEVARGNLNPSYEGFPLSGLFQLEALMERANEGNISTQELQYLQDMMNEARKLFQDTQNSGSIAFDSGQTYGPSAPPSQPSVAPAPAQPAVTPLDDNPRANDPVPLTFTELTQLGLLPPPAEHGVGFLGEHG